MNMSTIIDDLPDADYAENEEFEGDFEEQQYSSQHKEPHQHGTHYRVQEEDLYDNQSNQMNIRKKYKNESFFSILKKEINEKNLLILIILFVATIPASTDYTEKFLTMFSISTTTFTTNHPKEER